MRASSRSRYVTRRSSSRSRYVTPRSSSRSRYVTPRSSSRSRYVACGSLPYRSVRRAVAVALAADVPFVPSLPRLSPSERVDRQRLRLDSFAAWPRLREALGRKRLPLLKVQIPGPWTSPEAWKEDPRPLLREFHSVAKELWVFLDEPRWSGLSGRKAEAASRELARAIRQVRAPRRKIGVHCCGETDWAAMFRAEPDLVSFDAALSWPSIAGAAPRNFDGLVFGVPLRWLARRKRTMPPLPRRHLHFSTACGLAYASPNTAASVEARLRRFILSSGPFP